MNKIPPRNKGIILASLTGGRGRAQAAEDVGLKLSELMTFADVAFETEMQDAEAVAEARVRSALWDAAVRGHIPAARLWLERSEPAEPAEEDVDDLYGDVVVPIRRSETPSTGKSK